MAALWPCRLVWDEPGRRRAAVQLPLVFLLSALRAQCDLVGSERHSAAVRCEVMAFRVHCCCSCCCCKESGQQTWQQTEPHTLFKTGLQKPVGDVPDEPSILYTVNGLKRAVTKTKMCTAVRATSYSLSTGVTEVKCLIASAHFYPNTRSLH